MSDTATDQLTIRRPSAADGLALHGLIASCPPLDVNSAYAYHLLVRHQAGTCAVAELDGELVGACTGYRLPESPSTLFIWQVAVSEAGRGRGLAGRMLRHVVDANPGVELIHTTIGPGNAASRRVFAKLAESLGAPAEYEPYLSADDCGPGHDPEDLLVIGPIPANKES